MNVLIVDDEVSFRMLLQNCLVDEGFSVFLADNGEEGLAKLAEQKVDIVISDLRMHVMDGITFCKTARSNPAFQHIPFLFVSAYGDREILGLISSLEHCAFLAKGRPTDELIQQIRQLTAFGNTGGDYLPLDGTQPPPELPDQLNEEPGKGPPTKDGISEHPRVLVVDDDDALRLLLEDILTREGFDVVTAADGQIAIELLREQTFDLVLSDIVMPNVSGYGLLTFLNQNLPSTHVIMLTAYSELNLAVECKELGADDFIGKPFMRGDLLNTIRQVLSK